MHMCVQERGKQLPSCLCGKTVDNGEEHCSLYFSLVLDTKSSHEAVMKHFADPKNGM